MNCFFIFLACFAVCFAVILFILNMHSFDDAYYREQFSKKYSKEYITQYLETHDSVNLRTVAHVENVSLFYVECTFEQRGAYIRFNRAFLNKQKAKEYYAP